MGGARKLLCTHVCTRECVKIFTVQNNSQKNFCQWHALVKLAKIFSGYIEISAYTVHVCELHQLYKFVRHEFYYVIPYSPENKPFPLFDLQALAQVVLRRL